MRKNWLMTVAGIMAGLGGVPILVSQIPGINPPHWWQVLIFPFLLVGVVGTVMLGVAGKGQDEHSTQAQTDLATIKNPEVQTKAAQDVVVAKVEAKIAGKP